MYDVAVVGGSLAGATTAYHLAAARYRVVLLERSPTYRRKACGEGLFPRGVEELNRLGVLDEVRRVAAPLLGVRFHAGAEAVGATFGTGDRTGLGIDRSRLDPLLLEHARLAGVDVRTGVAVRSLLFGGEAVAGVRTSQGDIRARMVVGADGIGSRVRHEAGLDRPVRGNRYGISAHLLLDAEPEPFVDVHFQDGHEVYVTPVGGRAINVAVLSGKALLSRMHGDPITWFTALVKTMVGSAACAMLDGPRIAGPFNRVCTRPWRRNLVLAGDAAGFFDPIGGEGMSSALIGARHCAAAVDEYLTTGDERGFRRYSRQRAGLVRNSDFLARLTLALAARPGVARLSIRQLARHPKTFARLVSISAGELPWRALQPSDALTLLPGIALLRKRRG